MTNSIICICGRTWPRNITSRRQLLQLNHAAKYLHSSTLQQKLQPSNKTTDNSIVSSTARKNAIKERESSYKGWWSEIMNYHQTPQYSPPPDLFKGSVFQGAPLSTPPSPSSPSSSVNELPRSRTNPEVPTAVSLGSTKFATGTQSTLSSPRSGSTLYHGFSIPVKPAPPGPEDCCMSGCAHCIYDIYEEDRQEYKANLAKVLEDIKKAGLPPPPNIKTSSASGAGNSKGDEDNDMDPSMKAFLELERKLKGN